MATPTKRPDFFTSIDGLEIRRQLVDMDRSELFSTRASFSADTTVYPDNLIPFVDKHMNYLRTHPALDAGQYLANLRLKTRIR